MGTIIPPFFTFLGFKLGLSRLLGGVNGGCKTSLLRFAFFLSPKEILVIQTPQQTLESCIMKRKIMAHDFLVFMLNIILLSHTEH
jgi:hypothetical protein